MVMMSQGERTDWIVLLLLLGTVAVGAAGGVLGLAPYLLPDRFDAWERGCLAACLGIMVALILVPIIIITAHALPFAIRMLRGGQKGT
jgi:hypothetical protein